MRGLRSHPLRRRLRVLGDDEHVVDIALSTASFRISARCIVPIPISVRQPVPLRGWGTARLLSDGKHAHGTQAVVVPIGHGFNLSRMLRHLGLRLVPMLSKDGSQLTHPWKQSVLSILKNAWQVAPEGGGPLLVGQIGSQSSVRLVVINPNATGLSNLLYGATKITDIIIHDRHVDRI